MRTRSARLASMVLAAYLVSWAERRSITTMQSGFWKPATADPYLRNSGFDTTSNGNPTLCLRHGCSPS